MLNNLLINYSSNTKGICVLKGCVRNINKRNYCQFVLPVCLKDNWTPYIMTKLNIHSINCRVKITACTLKQQLLDKKYINKKKIICFIKHFLRISSILFTFFVNCLNFLFSFFSFFLSKFFRTFDVLALNVNRWQKLC